MHHVHITSHPSHFPSSKISQSSFPFLPYAKYLPTLPRYRYGWLTLIESSKVVFNIPKSNPAFDFHALLSVPYQFISSSTLIPVPVPVAVSIQPVPNSIPCMHMPFPFDPFHIITNQPLPPNSSVIREICHCFPWSFSSTIHSVSPFPSVSAQ